MIAAAPLTAPKIDTTDKKYPKNKEPESPIKTFAGLKLYGKKNILVLELKVSDKEAIWRNVRRKICSKCRYPVPYTKETQKLTKCPKCGGLLVVRNLDTEKTMRVRLKEYKNRTYPLLDYFKKIGIPVKKINGEQSIENVFEDILKVVSPLIKNQNSANNKQAN